MFAEGEKSISVDVSEIPKSVNPDRNIQFEKLARILFKSFGIQPFFDLFLFRREKSTIKLSPVTAAFLGCSELHLALGKELGSVVKLSYADSYPRQQLPAPHGRSRLP